MIDVKSTPNRNVAYFGAFKFFFQRDLISGADRQVAWNNAKNDAAVYAFLAPSENLSVWVPVWCRD